MPRAKTIKVTRKVQAADFRSGYRKYSQAARGNRVVLIHNKRQSPKYLVDKEFLDDMAGRLQAQMETLAVLADPELAQRLIELGKTIDSAVRRGKVRLYTMDEVFS